MRLIFAVLILSIAAQAQNAETWRGLRVEPENRCSPYQSQDYRYSQSVEPVIVDQQGGMFSPYTCERFRSLTETHIEHIVARSEAHDSGLCSADDETRRRFAGDLRNLTLAAPGLNSRKGSNDAAGWLPDRNRCWFAHAVIAVRKAYGLTVDRAEADTLDRLMQGCETFEIQCADGQ